MRTFSVRNFFQDLLNSLKCTQILKDRGGEAPTPNFRTMWVPLLSVIHYKIYRPYRTILRESKEPIIFFVYFSSASLWTKLPSLLLLPKSGLWLGQKIYFLLQNIANGPIRSVWKLFFLNFCLNFRYNFFSLKINKKSGQNETKMVNSNLKSSITYVYD